MSMKVKNVNFGSSASMRIYGFCFIFWMLFEGIMMTVSGALAFEYALRNLRQPNFSSPKLFLWEVSHWELFWSLALFIGALTLGYGVFYRLFFCVLTLPHLIYKRKVRIRF